jgi:ribonuclease HII
VIRAGIDEAGYGPVLGPLVVAMAQAEGDAEAPLRELGVADSKRIHDTHDLGPLERIALPGAAWLGGATPASAADLFTLLGEDDGERRAPWMAGARDLRLPLAGPVAAWAIPGATPRGLSGRILHPRHLNAAKCRGINRAAAELDAVRGLLAALDPRLPAQVACDRLGGRKFYGDILQRTWPGTPAAVLEETPAAARYRCGAVEVGFLVGGESLSALVALASCIAKYVRELHMHLLNRWWSAQVSGLTHTAGYPQDAKRWLAAIGPDRASACQDELVRRGA